MTQPGTHPAPALDPQQTLRLQMAQLKLRYGHLTDSDVSFDYGKKDVMMTALEAKLGMTRDELNALLQELIV